MQEKKMQLEEIRKAHRAWLSRHGILDRPWFVLASAPNPTIPPDITKHAALICINNSVATSTRLGLPEPALTFRNSSKEWKSVEGCRFPLILWITNRNTFNIHLKRYFIPGVKIGEIRSMRKKVRTSINNSVLDASLDDVGEKHKPSTGVFAVLYGIFLGVPEIILGGVAMEGDGYSYGSLPGVQKHREEDRTALTEIAQRYPIVRTTEAEVSAQTGIPLFRGQDNRMATSTTRP